MSVFIKGFTLCGIIFDFDGTLAVPTLDFELMRRQARAALAKNVPGGYAPLSAEDRPMLEELHLALAELDCDIRARAWQAALDAMAEVELEAAGRSSLFDFVRPMLASLASRGVRTGVITRNCRAAVERVFPDWREHLTCLLTREDVDKVKPDPAHLLDALERMGCKPAQALMVGDHPMDIAVGRKAGTRTAGVASAQTPFADLVKEKPTWLAKDAGALMRWLGLADQLPDVGENN